MPVSCDWHKEQEKLAASRKQAERAELRARSRANDSGMRAIPKLEPATLDIEVGDKVYYKSTSFTGWAQDAFAKEYLVTDVDGNNVWVVRDQKTGYKQVPAETTINRLYVKTGVEYVEWQEYGTETEDDDE